MGEREKEMSDSGFAHVVISEEYEKQTKGCLLPKIEKDSCMHAFFSEPFSFFTFFYNVLLPHASLD